NAGQNAAYRAIDRILPHLTAQKSLRLAFLPSGEDPDSLIQKKGPAAMQAILEQATGVFDAVWNRELHQTPATPEGRAALQAEMDAQIRQINDPVLQQNYRQTLKDRLFHLNRAASPAGKFPKGKKPGAVLPVKIRKPTDDLEKRSWHVLLAA